MESRTFCSAMRICVLLFGTLQWRAVDRRILSQALISFPGPVVTIMIPAGLLLIVEATQFLKSTPEGSTAGTLTVTSSGLNIGVLGKVGTGVGRLVKRIELFNMDGNGWVIRHIVEYGDNKDMPHRPISKYIERNMHR